MGRYTGKPRGVGKRAAAKRSSPSPEVRTRAASSAGRTKPLEEIEDVIHGSYIQLRNRSVPARPLPPKKPVNSGDGAAGLEGISRRESNASTSGVYLDRTSTREGTPTSFMAAAAAEMEAMPSAAEMEDFFAAAEAAERRRFLQKYNYDVENDAPLDGRYEWAPLEP